jgi:hypothetical protein
VHAPTIGADGVASQDPGGRARLPRRAARVRRPLPRHVACGAALGGGAGSASSTTSELHDTNEIDHNAVVFDDAYTFEPCA